VKKLGVERLGVERSGHKGNTKGMAKTWTRFCAQLYTRMDQCANALLHAEKIQMGKSYASHLAKTKLATPEEEVRQLIITAASLGDVWKFFLKRLKSGSPLDFLCFSVLDERGDFIRVRFMYSQDDGEMSVHSEPAISLADQDNHLVQAYRRKDTTFSPDLSRLGPEILNQLSWTHEQLEAGCNAFNLFSVPLIAGNDAIAMMTLGYREMDAFSQAKLSYVYSLRDQVAQLIWNLVLRDRMKSQAQVDNLTGLLSYTYFQGILDREIAKADHQCSSVSVMVLDINQIQEINRTLGHQAGDEAICHLASTVRRMIRGVDTVARYGGDEVVVILPETDSEAAHAMAERFLEGLQIRLPAHLQQLSVNIGHATYPDDTKSRDKLLKLVEQALHLAKFKGEKTETSTCIGSSEIDQLNDKTVIEVFASQVAKKYDNIHVPSVYQDLLNHIEKRNTPTDKSPQTDDLMLETITSLAGALEAKDRYTRGHSQAVANYAVALAHALNMTAAEVEEIRAAAFLHDIGKIGIPETILCKNGPLNEKEWEIMKQHAVIGAQQILHPVTVLRPIIPAVECHHENWDGSGHPHGLKGEKIPLGARIIAIVDAFHALTSDRPYRKALPVAEARKIMDAGSGTRWDPHLLAMFFGIVTMATPKTGQPSSEMKPELAEIRPLIQPVQLRLSTP
jgi:diguanylate cyclase (GGDEF)-like protein/putative nucleotidyltransferase with HDIG domain